MPLFTKEPLRLRHEELAATVTSQFQSPYAPIFSRLLFEDADESDWMYVATSRQMNGLKDKVQRKLRIFNAMTSYERRHTRVRIRNGTEMTVQLFRSDSIHDEDCIAYYDLRTLQNVKNIFIKEEEALSYLSFRDGLEDDTSGGGDMGAMGGIAVTEMVFGDIGLRLEFEESVSDGAAAHHRGGGVHHGFGGQGAGVGGSSDVRAGAAELASMMWSPFDRVATAVANEMNADGNTDATRPRLASSGDPSAIDGKSSKKLQKKLERKGKAVSIHLVFPTVGVREEWGHWFRVLMRHLELQRIAEQEIDAVTGLPIETVDADFVQRITDARTSTLSAPPFLKAVKDLTTKFMNLDIAVHGSLEPPSKGRLQARVPGNDHVGHYELSAWVQSAEVVITPYKPKESIAKSLLNFHHAFRSGGGSNGWDNQGGGTGSGVSKEPVRKIRLTDLTVVRAVTPWSCEFQIVFQNPHAAANLRRGDAAAGGGGVTWHFVAASAEERKSFVEWLRLVKGRGTKSQTEAETYPFQFQPGKSGEDGGDGGWTGEGGELGDDYMFLDAYEGQRRRQLLKELHSSPMIEEAAAAAAAFATRRGQGELSESDSDEAVDGERGNDRRRRSRSGSVAVVQDPVAIAAALAAAAAAEAAEQKRKQHLAILDAEYQWFRDLKEPFPSPRSDDTAHSVRRFAYFPGHRDAIVSSYLDDVCAVHLVGRRERAGLAKHASERGRAKRHWAYAEAARQRSPSKTSSPLGGRSRRGSSFMSSGPNGGSFALVAGGGPSSQYSFEHASSADSMSTDAAAAGERSVLVQQLLVTPAKRAAAAAAKNHRVSSPSASAAAVSPRTTTARHPGAASFSSPLLAARRSSFGSSTSDNGAAQPPAVAGVATSARGVYYPANVAVSHGSSSSNSSSLKSSAAAGPTSRGNVSSTPASARATLGSSSFSPVVQSHQQQRPNLKPGAFSNSLIATPRKDRAFT